VQMSEPVLRDLAAETGETVNLGVLYGDQILFVARIPRRDTLVAANLRVGSTVPAVFSSIGKTILAYLSDEELSQRVAADSFRGTGGPRAVTTADALNKQLESARRTATLSSATRPFPASARHRVVIEAVGAQRTGDRGAEIRQAPGLDVDSLPAGGERDGRVHHRTAAAESGPCCACGVRAGRRRVRFSASGGVLASGGGCEGDDPVGHDQAVVNHRDE
jgi:hypothetical protein